LHGIKYLHGVDNMETKYRIQPYWKGQKVKTSTFDMLNTIVFGVWYLKRTNICQLSNTIKLDRMSIARNLNILEHLCVLKMTGKRVKYYEVEPAVEKLLLKKGELLINNWLRESVSKRKED